MSSRYDSTLRFLSLNGLRLAVSPFQGALSVEKINKKIERETCQVTVGLSSLTAPLSREKFGVF